LTNILLQNTLTFSLTFASFSNFIDQFPNSLTLIKIHFPLTFPDRGNPVSLVQSMLERQIPHSQNVAKCLAKAP